jgi:putative transposase
MKHELLLSLGSEILYQGQLHIIKTHLSLTTFLLLNKKTGAEVVAELNDLSSINELSDTSLEEAGTIRINDKAWKKAEHRVTLIKQLAEMNSVPGMLAKEVGLTLGISQQMVYKLIRRYRDSGGLLSSLAPSVSSGGRGKSRMPSTVEQIMTVVIAECYLTKQKRSMEDIGQEVRRQCIRAKLKPPSTNTVRDRIRLLSARDSIRQREGTNAARKLSAVKGSFPAVESPLDVIQMDHTPVDLIIVDEITRRPIGRPYLTASIDVFSRCITGFCLTLEAPSAVSIGLCLVHSVIDKAAYLANLGITGEWPIWGKPLVMYVDNGSDFHSEALQRGCAQHGIELRYRPLGQPQYGGIIERLIGTLMQQVHTLPGTTFSNIVERGEYNSDAKAILTLSELEKWLTLVIVGQYHNKIHSTLHEPPIERYKSGVLSGKGPKSMVQNKKGFLIDFLPIIKRSIQRHGFMVDHINYYSNALQPWIAERNKAEQFIIRRDPRDISRIYVLPPDQNEYIEVSYRTLSHPAVTLWEHRESLKYLKERGASKVDEAAIFKAIEAMRKITDDAARSTRAARRRKARSNHITQQSIANNQSNIALLDYALSDEIPLPIAKPFENIEEW